jgi:hypothetical protein
MRGLHKLVVGLLAIGVLALSASTALGAGGSTTLPVRDAGKPLFTTMGGARPLSTAKTVPHWHSQFTDPTNGVTYGYNMVGSTDPRSPDAGTTTVATDIVPLNFVFAASGGFALNGSDVSSAIVNSPIFQPNDYSSTAFATDQHYLPTPGGVLSPGNVGVQYEDAIMRSQFNKTGSNFHLQLGQPNVLDPVTIVVPQNQGFAAQNGRGVIFGLVSIQWFAQRLGSLLGQLHVDSTHLPIFLTDNVMLYIHSPDVCCVIGFHGAKSSFHGNGNQDVQTYAYSAYTHPGTFFPGSDGAYFLQDIHALSHEIAEWGDDPFINNLVDPWLTPTAPQYGCTDILETGDPVVASGCTLPGTTYGQNGPYPGDTYWHPEDEVLLPWFAREDPNVTSQTVQGGSTGRYTFMGNLNPFPGFQVPATGC